MRSCCLLVILLLFVACPLLAADIPALVGQLASESDLSGAAAIRDLVTVGPAVVPALERLFAQQEGSGRQLQRAVEALIQINDPASTALLVRALQRGIEPYRVAFTLAGRGEEGFQAALSGLQHRDPAVVTYAAMALGRQGKAEAVPALTAAFQAGNGAAAGALAQIRPAGLPPLLAALRSPTPTQVAQAASALGGVKDPDIPPALLPLLGHPEKQVRIAAMGALGHQQYSAAAQPISRHLRDRDPQVRTAAGEALVWLKALAPLVKLLHDPDPAFRLSAVRGLSNSYTAESRQALLAALADAEPAVREEAAQQLDSRPEPDVVRGVRRYLGDRDQVIRNLVASILYQAGPGELQATLPTFLSNERMLAYLPGMVSDFGYTNAFAEWMLRHLRGTPAVGRLAGMVARARGKERQQAMRALVATEDPQAGVVLIRELGDGDPDVAREAAIALALYLEEPAALDPLRAYLKRADPEARGWAVSALANCGGPQAIPDLLAALRDAAAEPREAAARELGRLDGVLAHGDRLIPPLVAALLDPAEDVAAAAAESLVVFGSAAEPALRAAVGQASTSPARRRVVECLAYLATADSVPVLFPIVQEPDKELQAAALAGLAKAHDPRAYDLLFPLLSSSDPLVQLPGISGLGQLGDRRAAPALVPLLQSGDRLVREAAAEALGALGCREAIPQLSALANHVFVREEGDPPVLLFDPHPEDFADGTAAVRALGLLHDPAVVPVLLKVLQRGISYEFGSSPATAAEALAAYDQPEVRDALLAALGKKQAEEYLVAAAADTLAKLHEPRAVPRLLELLNHPKEVARHGAVKALGELGDRRAIPALIPLLAEERYLRKEVEHALTALTRQDFGRDQARWQQWWEQEQKQAPTGDR